VGNAYSCLAWTHVRLTPSKVCLLFPCATVRDTSSSLSCLVGSEEPDSDHVVAPNARVAKHVLTFQYFHCLRKSAFLDMLLLGCLLF
jgi:hypothetical protein